MKHVFILVLVLLSGTFRSVSFAQTSNLISPLHFEHFTIKDGLAGNIVWNILQDRKGYMWFGTLSGLSRYDGYKFTNYTYRPHDTTSISQNVLFSLYEDSEGAIWSGTTEGGICKFDAKTEQFTTYRPPQPKGLYVPALRAVSAIMEDPEGRLWIGNFEGELWRFDKNTGEFLELYDLKKETKSDALKYGIYCIYKDPGGVLWIGSSLGLHRLNFSTGKVNRLTRIGFTHFLPDPTHPNSLSGGGVWSVFKDHLGFLWVGTNANGLNRFDPKTGRFTHYLNKPNDPFSISNNGIFHQSITEDSQGNLWVGTYGGLNKLNPERTRFSRFFNDPFQPSSPGSNVIQSLCFDKAGILWVGTIAGISKWMPNQKPFRLYTHNPYISNSLGIGLVRSIYEDKGGNLWIGTETLNKFNNQTGTFTHYHPNNRNISLNNDGFNALTIDRYGTFWVALGNQLMRFNPKTGTFTTSGSKLLDEKLKKTQNIRSIYEDSEGLLWISTDGVISYNSRTGAFQHYVHDPNNPNGISDYQANVIYSDSRGNIWIGHGSVALTRYNKRTGKFTRFSHDPKDTKSICSNVIRSLYEDKQGDLWIGSTGGGFCRFDYKTEKFTTYAAKQGLTATEVSSILEDGNSNLWLGTDQGIFSFSLTTHKFKRYDASDGLQSNSFSAAARRGSNGTLYMGGSEGFNAFDPTQIKPNPAVPPVVITEFKLFDKPVPGRQEAKIIALNYNQNFFSFEFAALNFTNSSKNQYAYQLVGIDRDWVYCGTRRNVSYTDLPPGDYTFRVKASNNDGIWNEKGISIQVIISPPWWKTWWAYSFYALCCMIGVVALNRMFRNRLIAREREKAREKELAQAREIEKAYKQLKATQAQLIQKEKLAGLGELTAGIAHEIQNPLNFVNNFSELSIDLAQELKEEIEKSEPDKELVSDLTVDLVQNQQKINLHGKRASNIVKGMLEHSRGSTGQKELTDINQLVDEYLRLALHGLRVKDNTFNVMPVTDFDPGLPKIEVIPQDIGRVLLNLINNAFYAVAKVSDPMLTISTKNTDNHIIIQVFDNGTGMSKEVLAKIFQPFFTTKPTGEGIGLGLSLAYDIITKGHGGTIAAESEKGVGTTFTIKLPI